jgi:hypothetical protein
MVCLLRVWKNFLCRQALHVKITLGNDCTLGETVVPLFYSKVKPLRSVTMLEIKANFGANLELDIMRKTLLAARLENIEQVQKTYCSKPCQG